MSYNVLSQDLLLDNWYLYTKCPDHVLKWETRSKKLLEEIKLYRPDVRHETCCQCILFRYPHETNFCSIVAHVACKVKLIV